VTQWDKLGTRVRALTERLVRTPSVVDSDGEGIIADLLAQYLRDHSAQRPDVSVQLVEVAKRTSCRAVLAYAPAPVESPHALAIMGHIDTVGLESYGILADHAFDSDALKQHFAQSTDAAVAEHAVNPDWAFGRGWLDMKGGVAVNVEVFLREMQRRKLPAHLLLLLTPDEESASRGVRALIPEINKLSHEHGFKLTQVINTDYTAPLTTGDKSRYIYSGTTGKLLIGVSVFGRTTHAGEPFAGVNASALAGYLASTLEHNRKLLSGVGGEWLPPPVVLHMGDQRLRYDVMTTDYAALYMNMFHLGENPAKLWATIKHEVHRLVKRYDREMRLRYNRYTSRANIKLPRYPLRPEVIDYQTLLQRVAQQGHNAKQVIEGEKAAACDQNLDVRQQAFRIVQGLCQQLSQERPLVVLSLLQPFYPAFTSAKTSPAVATITELCKEHSIKHRRVYPYISDMSYFCFGKLQALQDWAAQSPLWLNPEELAQYQQATTSVMNLGPWGIGAHSAEERVYLPFLCDILPRLLTDTLYLLAKQAT